MDGIINLYKPRGVTSTSLVSKVKFILKEKKVGHLGTLDPLAEGVFPVCIGRATKLFDLFLKKRKAYEAIFCFGEETSTLDLEGDVVKTSNTIVLQEDLNRVLKTFVGKQKQIPPIFSAKKIKGKTAYDLARQGKQIELQPCEIEIFDIRLLKQIDKTHFLFYIECSAGTYIRSIARDLGHMVNSCATMTSLKRVKSGPFTLENAINVEENFDIEKIQSNLVSITEILKDFKNFDINDKILKDLLDGKKVRFESITANKTESFINRDDIIVLRKDKKAVAIANIIDDIIKVKNYF